MDGVLILAIETATGCGSIALTRGDLNNGHLLAEAVAQPEKTHSRQLLSSVDWVMKAAGIGWPDVNGIAISLGPGSFTGLRIGMAAAKGIALAADLPLVGIPTLDGLAHSCPVIDRPLWSLLDARKQEVYAACYQPGIGGRPELVAPARAICPEALAKQISVPSILAGPGVDEYHELFARIANIHLIPAALSSPRAARIGLLAAEYLARGEFLDQITAAPMYVRASEAEINLQAQTKR